ncbi:hypothetical protein IQ283_08480 (plasmid) [Alkalihalobacillus hwajinpoensis]|uniref:hypothetical protein n=1 Tax=Guptibacillus hwajinpoensis TaxID=208199 RepID=UPI001883DCBE|nr:hypothetical protein [Pseudalkalibacillus hwajinpoensis]MBF0706645.1 hypothetical protein [Pseudalkalibacillus hwajinpoensis]
MKNIGITLGLVFIFGALVPAWLKLYDDAFSAEPDIFYQEIENELGKDIEELKVEKSVAGNLIVTDPTNRIKYNVTTDYNGAVSFISVAERAEETKILTPGENIDNSFVFDGFIDEERISISYPEEGVSSSESNFRNLIFRIEKDKKIVPPDYEGKITIINLDQSKDTVSLKIEKDLSF